MVTSSLGDSKTSSLISHLGRLLGRSAPNTRRNQSGMADCPSELWFDLCSVVISLGKREKKEYRMQGPYLLNNVNVILCRDG